MGSTAGSPPRGGWYYGWNIVAFCVLSQLAAMGVAVNSMSLFLAGWSADLHAPISRLLLAMLPMACLTAVVAPIVGALADKRPSRWLFGIGLAGVAAFSLGISLTRTIWQFWVLYGVLAPIVLTLATSIPANAVVSRWFVKRLGLALGITAFGMGISGVVLPPLIAAGMPTLGWRGVWRITAAAIAFVVLPAALIILRDRPTAREGLDYVAGGEKGHAHHGHAGGELGWGDIAKRRNFWLLAGCLMPVLAANGGIQANIAPIAASHGFGQAAAGTLLSAFSLSYIGATLLMGLASDRFGNRIPLAALAAIVALGAATLAFANTWPAILGAVVLVGFGGGIWASLPAAVALEYGPAGVGRACGMLMLFTPINAAVAPLIAKVKESAGSYTPALLGLAAVSVAGGLLALLLRERRGGHLTAAEKTAALQEPVNPIP